MCGIYFSAGSVRPELPKIFHNKEKSNNFPSIGLDQIEYCFNGDEVDELVEADREVRTKLDFEAELKLSALPKLRGLQSELNRAKNAKNSDECATIQAQIDALQEQEPTTPTGYFVQRTLTSVMARGPDYSRYLAFTNENTHFLLLSSVLSLRQPFTEQPVTHDGLIFQYNGELYNRKCIEGNDTQFILDRISQSVMEMAANLAAKREEAILAALTGLEGEYAFVLTDIVSRKTYFGKDFVGKRSLLYNLTGDSLLVSSVLPNYNSDLLECEGGIVYQVNHESYEFTTHALSKEPFHLKELNLSLSNEELAARTKKLHAELSKACLIRQETIHPLYESSGTIHVGVLFSGGLDCTVVAALLAQNYKCTGKDVEIDLITVGFENPRTEKMPLDLPDRILAEQSWMELCSLFQGTCVSFRLVQVDVSYAQWLCHKNAVQELIHPTSTEMDLSIAIAFYFACRARDCLAVELGSLPSQPTQQAPRLEKVHYTSPAKVLFSGLGADELFGGYSRHEGVFNGLEEGSARVEHCYETLNAELAKDISIIYVRNLGRDDRAMCNWGKELRYPFLDQLVIRFAFEEVEPNLKVKFEWVDQKSKKGVKRLKQFERKHILRQLARILGISVAAEEPKRAIQFGAKTAKMEIGLGKAKGTDSL